MTTTESVIVIVGISIACAAGHAAGVARRFNILEAKLDRLEQKIDQAKPTE